MKNWKKYLALLSVALLIVAFAACAPVEEEPSDPPAEQTEAPTETPTEAPTEAPTEVPTEAPTEAADYSAYMGNWYAGTVTFTVEAENKWAMLENGEVFISGHFVVVENGSLTLYDVEGVEVANMLLEEDNTVYAELYVEDIYTKVNDFIFTRTASSGNIITDIEDPVEVETFIEDPQSGEIDMPEDVTESVG